MSRRTLTMSSLVVKQSRIPGNYVLDNVEGQDVLEVAKNLANTVTPQDLGITDNKWWCEVEDIEEFKRGFMVKFASGSYGEARRVVDVNTGKPAYNGRPHDSHLVSTRAIFVVPPGQKIAYLVIEREGNETAGVRFRTLLHDSLVAIGPVLDSRGNDRDIVASFSTVTEGEAWLNTAELRRIELIREEARIDPGDGTDPLLTNVRLREIVEPTGSSHWLPQNIWQQIRGMDAVSAASYLQFPDHDGIDEVIVTASNQEKEKTFSLGRERSPGIRLVIKDHGDPVPDTLKLIRHAESLTVPHLKDVHGIDWDHAWVSGK